MHSWAKSAIQLETWEDDDYRVMQLSHEAFMRPVHRPKKIQSEYSLPQFAYGNGWISCSHHLNLRTRPLPLRDRRGRKIPIAQFHPLAVPHPADSRGHRVAGGPLQLLGIGYLF